MARMRRRNHGRPLVQYGRLVDRQPAVTLSRSSASRLSRRAMVPRIADGLTFFSASSRPPTWRAKRRMLDAVRVRAEAAQITGGSRRCPILPLPPQPRTEAAMSATEAATMPLSNSFFSAGLADADPEIARAIELELGRQRDEIELIASREHRLPRRARGAGLGDDQQVRRGLSGPALLRRLRVRRHRREASPSSAPAACSTAASPTCSRTPAARRTRPCSWR